MILPNPTSIIHPVKCESNINAPTLPWIICEQFVIHIIQASGRGSGTELCRHFPEDEHKLKWTLSAVSLNLNAPSSLLFLSEYSEYSLLQVSMLFNQGQTVDWSKWDSQAHPINFDRQIKNHTPIYQSACLAFFFFNVCCFSCRTLCELQLSFLLNKYIFLNCQSRPSQRWPVIFYWSSRKASARKTKTCHQRGEIPAIWPAIRGDSGMSAVCETSGRVSLLFAHFKVKSDSSVNPLWTSLTACVIWNATHPLVQNFCHASQSGQLLMETMLLSSMWQRDGGGRRSDG